jgi:cytochrome c biogenesis protein CcmG/thiol:disulfide interchange protein DsbE
MRKLGWKMIPIVLFILLSLVFWRGLSLDPHSLPSVQLGKRLPSWQLPTLGQKDTGLPKQVILLNVWASWCEACLAEQALLMELSAQKVPIYGINYKDKSKDAKHWLALWGNPYLLVWQDKLGKLGMDLGVYGAPETFLIDKQGIIRYRHVGVLTSQVWVETLGPLMRHWEQLS